MLEAVRDVVAEYEAISYPDAVPSMKGHMARQDAGSLLLQAAPNTSGKGAPELARALERGRIVYFPQCPVPLPGEAELRFLREDLQQGLGRKNVSWYPDGDRLVGLKAEPPVRERARSLLSAHARGVDLFLNQLMPDLMRGARRGTSSFRPVQERGRDLSPHASNELIHIDAGAYGATHGDRILRFFVNVNPSEDRVWASRGSFADLLRRYGTEAGIAGSRQSLVASLPERLYSGTIRAAAHVVPAIGMIDTSPFDRLMRRFHNFMKDSPSFRDSREGLVELAFKPFSAWMVLTDTVSHACLSGQHALVDTFIVPRANCTERDADPWELLAAACAGAPAQIASREPGGLV